MDNWIYRSDHRGSRRVIPVHPELVRLGFVDFVEQARRERGRVARLFPLLNPGPRGGFGEGWSKWFGRYIRSLGITNKHRVFHSFRQGVQRRITGCQGQRGCKRCADRTCGRRRSRAQLWGERYGAPLWPPRAGRCCRQGKLPGT